MVFWIFNLFKNSEAFVTGSKTLNKTIAANRSQIKAVFLGKIDQRFIAFLTSFII